jgi:hypothetical protein
VVLAVAFAVCVVGVRGVGELRAHHAEVACGDEFGRPALSVTLCRALLMIGVSIGASDQSPCAPSGSLRVSVWCVVRGIVCDVRGMEYSVGVGYGSSVEGVTSRR